MNEQNEITSEGELLNERGHLNYKGWARKPYLKYNRENIGKKWFRIKEWDYYAIMHPDYAISFTIADLGIMGIYNVVWIDFKEKNFVTGEESKLFTKGQTNLPISSEKGDIHYKGKNFKISILKKDNQRIINFDFSNFTKNSDISGELVLYQDPNMDTMVIATPWKNNPKCFYYNQKINCMPTEGIVKYVNKEYSFKKENSFAVLDWGRGVWPYKDIWYWGSASGIQDGVSVGFNIGYGFGDTSAATENIFYYDNKGHKLDQVTFHIDESDYLKPWKFTSNDGRFEMDFEPIIDRNSKVNLLIFKSIQHQVFGYFTGKVILDDGTEVKVDKLLGFAEKVINRW
ncbi:MAG: DUF2804 domain-containing protein [Candidatus Heimdallarchaeum endolithica]|uniref:DUF2804 domain-containing protein n=1 Tax=Candidatus Heimdallarchaeum endolithica TaxID=2876572 RepID=A0A9Y1FPU9_9ARCH|nr:MAG: DUF2804 domain-containing protein [Candidatus Heimdallarchaeum endolithica]